MKVLDRNDVENLCLGATVLGTGGGGSPDLGLFLLNRLMEMGKKIRLISVDEVPDEEIVIHPATVGSIAPARGEERKTEDYRSRILAEDGPLPTGLRTLAEVMDRKAYAAVPVERGRYNTPVAAIRAGLTGQPSLR
jgi:DUF917 family protein